MLCALSSPELYGIALGALQGVAEFLPISSSGHLSLGQAWLGIDPNAGGHTFNVVVHAGTLLAVLWVYRKDLWSLRHALTPSHPQAQAAKDTLVAVFLGCLPLVLALIPGVKATVMQMEGNVTAIGIALLVTAALLAFSHRKTAPQDPIDLAPAPKIAFLIGCAQVLAIMPGISRSGSTIACALALGLGRSRAARFSFLLSIPAVGAATLLELKDALESTTPLAGDPNMFALGFVTSLVVGLLTLKALLAWISRLGLLPFVPYLVIVGCIAIASGSGLLALS